MENSGLVAAYLLDGQGGGKRADWQQIETWKPAAGWLWVHLDHGSAESRTWLQQKSGLDELVVDALLAENTRPRCSQMEGGTLLFLRGVNLNPGADPEDMVSIRLWIEPTRVISVRLRRLVSIDDLKLSIEQGRGPVNVGEFVIQLAEHLSVRMASVISDIDDDVDRLQDQVLSASGRQLRTELTQLRREIITLRRYLAPQRDALLHLALLKTDWLKNTHLPYVREESDRIARYVEDLDAARERAAVTQEELTNRLSEQMNSRMYILSMVAGIFLPLGFLTGLFGINVGGIPLANSPSGFFDILLLLALITGIQVVIFRWRNWF